MASLKFDEAIASHESVFDLSDLCECLDADVLEALRNNKPNLAGIVLMNNMKNLIVARAIYALGDES